VSVALTGLVSIILIYPHADAWGYPVPPLRGFYTAPVSNLVSIHAIAE